MIKELLKIVKKLDGKLLVIGNFDTKILNCINNNNNIISCDILTSKNDDTKYDTKGKQKKINISSLRRKYKKKKINYIIADINEIDKYLKTFVKDSIFINQKEIIFLSDKNYDYDLIKNKYKRYKTDIEVLNYKDGKILKINTVKAKTNKIKDFVYYIVDTILNIIDLIGEFLVS